MPRTFTIIAKKSIIFLLVIGAIGGSFVLGMEYLKLKTESNDKNVTKLTEKLSKHMILPEEEPLIATVTDVETLKKEQPFYRNAQNNDKVFIWKDKALIYRSDEDKIIDFGIILDTTEKKSEPVRVVVLNGSGVQNSASEIKTQIENSAVAASIAEITTDNAQAGPYPDSVVVDLTGDHGSIVSALAATINGKVSTSLPEEELANTTADIIIVVGTASLNEQPATVSE